MSSKLRKFVIDLPGETITMPVEDITGKSTEGLCTEFVYEYESSWERTKKRLEAHRPYEADNRPTNMIYDTGSFQSPE